MDLCIGVDDGDDVMAKQFVVLSLCVDDKCIVFISVYASESPVVVQKIRYVLPFQL